MSNKLLIIVLAVFVLMMGMMGAGFFILWKQMNNAVAQVQQQATGEQTAEEETPQEQEASIGPTYKLETLIVNLADQGGKRYLRLTMEFEMKPAENAEPNEVVEELEKRLPQIRDSILMILPTKQYADIATTAGKTALRDEIISTINTFLKKGQISTIYFTEFVVQ